MISFSRSAFYVLSITLCLSLIGCEQITALTEKFTGKKEEAKPVQAKPKPAPKPAAQAQAKTTPAPKENKPLAANVIARVGDWEMTVDEFEERLEGLTQFIEDFDPKSADDKSLVLEELIRQQLLIKYAEKKGVDKNKDIQRAVTEFRNTLLVREVVADMTDGIKVDEEDASKFYDENKENFVEVEQVRVREIVAFTQAGAKEILVELLQGADFADTARARSKSKTASLGGDLGFISAGTFPQMQSALGALEVGDISSVFKGPDGFYIIKLEEKKGGKPVAFDTIKEDLVRQLTLEQQQEAIVEKLNEVAKDIQIDVNESLLGVEQ